MLAGVPAIPLVFENAVGAQNLRKVAAARKGCRSRSGHTLQEDRSPGEMVREETPRTSADVEYPKVDCRGLLGTTA